MCPNYNYEERVEKHRLEQDEADELEQQETQNETNSHDSAYSDDYLLEHGIPDDAEEWELQDLEARWHIVKYGAGSLTLDEMKQVFSCASDEFLSAFLKRAGMDESKIPKGQAPKIARCVKWAEEPNAEHRSFVLLTIAELKEVYCKKA